MPNALDQRIAAARARLDDALGLRPARTEPSQPSQPAPPAAMPQQGLAALPQPTGGLGALQAAPQQ